MGDDHMNYYVDSILVPVSVLLTMGYHTFLWHNLKKRPTLTYMGINAMKRRAWLRQLNQGDEKKGTLAVQSLRNTLMYAILSATITATITVALGALTNNALTAAHLLRVTHIFGSQSTRILVFKYGTAAIVLLASLVCSSMAVGCLVDANFLINAIGGGEFSGDYTEGVLERGFTLAVVGNRVLCLGFTLLLWLFGPLPVALSSLALVSALYHFDFAPNYFC